MQTFGFFVHKLHHQHSIFHWLHTFENETPALHNSIPTNLTISSSWLTWFLHIALRHSGTCWNMFRYHGLRNPRLTHLEELKSWHVQGYPNNISFTYIPLPYLPSRHQFINVFPPSRLNNYTNMHGGTITLPLIIKHNHSRSLWCLRLTWPAKLSCYTNMYENPITLGYY